MGAREHSPRWLALDGLANARAVVPGVLLRADNLQSLSARDIRRLVDEHEMEVVIDLRTDMEVRFEGPGPLAAEPRVRVELRSLYPDSGAQSSLDTVSVRQWWSHDESTALDEQPVVRTYMNYLGRRPDSIVGAVRAIARSDGAVLIHCAAGKDRTGVVVALALDAAGIDRETIVADYLASADRIEAIVARLAGSSLYRDELRIDDPHQHAPVPGTMERVLQLVDARHGGSAAWLLANGLDDTDLQRLRRRLTLAPVQAEPL
jgi:hypothetical protein